MSRSSGVTKNDQSGYFLTQSEPVRYSGVDEELSEDHVFWRAGVDLRQGPASSGSNAVYTRVLSNSSGVSSAEITVAKGLLSS